MKNNSRHTWAFWIPIAVIIIAVTASWFWDNRLQFEGDFVVPQDPTRYVSRLTQSWDSTPDLGLLSLLTLIPVPPRSPILIFFSAIFAITGSMVAVEFALVALSLLLSSLGMYLLVGLFDNPGTRYGQVVASLLFTLNPYVTIYLQNPLVIFSYATIPWCLFFAIRGLRGENPTRNSICLAIGFTSSLVTFPQAAISAIIFIVLIGLAVYKAITAAKMRWTQFKFVAASLMLTFGLNAYWLLLLFTRVDFFQRVASSVPSSQAALNSQNSAFAVFRLLGDWTLFAQYQGRLYIPYSSLYSNDLPTLLATITIPALAFTGLVMKHAERRYLAIGAATLLALFLAKGVNPPLGFLFSDFLNVSIFKIFRNPPRYFLAIVSLGYALLIGGLVSTLLATQFKRIRSVVRLRWVITALVVAMILISASPMLTGAVTTNWYQPDLHGYQIPTFYNAAEHWLVANGATRVLVLPRTGVYMATYWGYQGANIYPYVFSQDLVTASGGQYTSGGQYASTSGAALIDAVYSSLYENKTTNFGQVLEMIGVSHVVVDKSVDTQFYPLPSSNATISLLRLQTDITERTTLGQLTIFQVKAAGAQVRTASKMILLNGTANSPADIVSVDNFTDGWNISATYVQGGNWGPSATLTHGQGEVDISIQANGQYEFAELRKNVSISNDIARYAVLRFETSSPTSVALYADTANGEISLYAANPTPFNVLNHYSTPLETNLLFPLDQISSTITTLKLAISNKLDPSFSGILSAELVSISFANQAGQASDVVDFAQKPQFNPTFESIALTSQIATSVFADASQLSSSGTSPSYFDTISFQPTHVTARYTSSSPFVLVYLTNFDEGFALLVDGQEVASHFQANGFANGWVITETGSHTIEIEFMPQFIYTYGIYVTLATISLIVMIVSGIFNRFVRLLGSLGARARDSQSPVPERLISSHESRVKEPSNSSGPVATEFRLSGKASI